MDKERISGDSAVKNVPEPHDAALHNHDENKSSASYLKSIFDTMPDWVWEIDQYGFITYSNPKVEKILGYSAKKINEKSFLQLVPKSDSLNAKSLLTENWDIKPQSKYLKHYFSSKEGKKIQLETTGSAFFDAHNNHHGTRFFSRPVEKMQPAEERKAKMSIFAANNTNIALAISNPDGIITHINNTASTMFGYTDTEIIGEPISILGTDESSEQFLPHDVVEALETYKVWHGESKRRAKNGQYIPCLIGVRAIEDKNGFKVCNVASYLDLRPINQSSLQNQKSLKKIINTICNAIEDRNVIKSQHQERVTDLAVAIAFEMGKSVKFIEGLTLACQLHDIGEMYIPPEIANRVGKLSESEFEMIRTHPKKGYEIIKEIDLPWPVADIILQHHERIDGSGYPHQLRGEEIMMEARIIAVSDLVETMLTDRPYRKACTLDECLEELESNKGILYDARVVDITLRLIREENYFLKNI